MDFVSFDCRKHEGTYHNNKIYTSQRIYPRAFIHVFINCYRALKAVDTIGNCGSVVAERLRAPNSNSGVSDQQSVGSNPKP